LIADQVILDNHPNMNPNLLIDIKGITLQNKRKEYQVKAIKAIASRLI
jgi:hypothetical protein